MDVAGAEMNKQKALAWLESSCNIPTELKKITVLILWVSTHNVLLKLYLSACSTLKSCSLESYIFFHIFRGEQYCLFHEWPQGGNIKKMKLGSISYRFMGKVECCVDFRERASTSGCGWRYPNLPLFYQLLQLKTSWWQFLTLLRHVGRETWFGMKCFSVFARI